MLEVTAWVTKKWRPWITTSLRVVGKTEAGIHARDPVITGGSPVFNAANSGRDELDIFLGVNLSGHNGWVIGQSLALELGMPIYEHVDGLQMSQEWTATLGWQFAW